MKRQMWEELQTLLGALEEPGGFNPFTERGGEAAARVLVAGLPGVGKSVLLNGLYGWEVATTGGEGGRQDLGLFMRVDLPHEDEWAAEAWMWGMWDGLDLGAYGDERGLILFVMDADQGLRPAEYRWFGRLRRQSWPVLPLLNHDGLGGASLFQTQRTVEQRLGTPVLVLDVGAQNKLLEALAPPVLRLCPELAVPLGCEFPELRPALAQALIQRSALRCAVLGLEPVPLLDLPLQLVLQVRLVDGLARLYGYGPLTAPRRELWLAVLSGLGIRYTAQQTAKVVPVAGWLASGALAAGGTWALGRAALTYLEQGMNGPRPVWESARSHLRQWVSRRPPTLGRWHTWWARLANILPESNRRLSRLESFRKIGGGPTNTTANGENNEKKEKQWDDDGFFGRIKRRLPTWDPGFLHRNRSSGPGGT